MPQTTVNSKPISGQFARLRWLLIVAFLIWLTFIISSFFVVNKPFDAGFIASVNAIPDGATFKPNAVARAFLDLGAAIWITIAATGVGLYLWRRIDLQGSDALATLLMASGLGFGILGLFTLVLGLMGIMTRLPLLIALVLLTILTGPQVLCLLRQLPAKRPPGPMMIYFIIVLGLVISLALLPPTSWDALFYHLKGPKLYLQTGRIHPGIDIPHLNFPSLLEMVFLFSMQIRGDVAAKLIHLIFALLLAGVVYLVTSRILQVRNAWLSLLFLFGTPIVLTLAAWAYNDLALSYYALASLFAFLRWHKTDDDRWLLFCGLLSGFLMGLKYTSIFIVIFLALATFWHRRHDRPRVVKSLFWLIAPATLLVAPWLLKNWLFTGNPVYPFLFEGRYWDDFRATAYREAGTGIGLNLISLVRLPYDMTLGYADASQEGTIGPFYLIFLPLVVFYGLSKARRRTPRPLQVLLLYAVSSFLFWTVGVMSSAALYQVRLLLPGLVALCPVLAWLMEDLPYYDLPQFSLRSFLNLVLIVVFALLLLNQLSYWLQINPLPYLLGVETRSGYLRRTLGAHYRMMETINAQAGAGSAVLFLWEPRSYYCDVDCRPDAILDRFGHDIHLYDNSGAIADAWRAEGISHVLVFDAGFNFLIESGANVNVETLRALREQHLTEIDSSNNLYTLYQLETRND